MNTEMNVHLAHAEAMSVIGCRRYLRHIKTHGFIRVPWCEEGLFLDPDQLNWEDPNPNEQAGETGGFFNYDLYNAQGQCREGNDWGSSFLRPIIANAHGQRASHTIGLYTQGYHDFFFETQNPTHWVSAAQPALGVSTPVTPSLSLSRIALKYQELLPSPQGFKLSEYTPADVDGSLLTSQSGGSLFTGNEESTTVEVTSLDCQWVTTGEEPPVWDCQTVTTTLLEPDPTPVIARSHFLCHSSPEWRARNLERYTTISRNGADCIFFDVRHMPEDGCFCVWCRMRYASLYSSGNPNNTGQDQWDTLRKNFVGNNLPLPTTGNLFSDQTHRLRDFDNVVLKEAFREYQDAMHQNGPDPLFGTLAIVSVQDLGALNRDDYRTDFAHLVDIPKTEWFTPIKGANNFVFWGQEFTDNSDYFSILSDYRIPEDIRVAGAFSVLRDASKYGRTYLWMPNEFRVNDEPSNYSVRNNQRLRSYLGFGYVLGATTSTSLGNFYAMDGPNSTGFKLSNKQLWDLCSVTDANLTQDVNPNASQITNIFDADEAMSAPLAGLKAVPYVGILYSEREINRYHYIFEDDLPNAALGLPIPSIAPMASTKTTAQRQALVWWNNLLHMYGAFHSLYNSRPVTIDVSNNQTVSYKFPTQFLTDWQLDGQNMNDNKAILVPLPIQSSEVTSGNPFLPLSMPTQIALNQLGIPKLPLFKKTNWYKQGADMQNDQLQLQTRNAVIEAVGLPDIYVTGHTANAHVTHAGFYTNMTHTRVAVPLVIEPMFGIPRTRNTKSGPVGNESLDLITTPSNTYNHAPLEVNEGDLIIHIRKGSSMMFSATNTNSYTAVGIFSDLVASQGQNLPLVVTETTDEYLISVPAFTCSMVVSIDIAH